MISDDLTILRINAEGVVEIAPGPLNMHLWADAAHALDFDLKNLRRHPLRHAKASVVAPDEPHRKPAPLRKLFIIEPSPTENVVVSRLKGVDAFKALLGCVYGPLIPEEHPGVFSIFSTTILQAGFYQIQRPESRWTLDAVVEVILDG